MQKAVLTEFIELSLDLEYKKKNPHQRTRSEDFFPTLNIIFEHNLRCWIEII